jgi:uncharacterized damage-inducible protein DinB
MMKTLIFMLFAALLAVGHSSAQTAPNDTVSKGGANENGKDFLLQYYQQTFDELQKSISGLNEAQLQFKPAAHRWSINQCLSHIVLTEKMIFDYAKKGMEMPANPKRKSDVKISDEGIIKGITDRSHKAKAPDENVGNDQKYTASQALSDLQTQRKEIIDYINKVPLEDLRNHINDSPFGPIDAYHSFLFISGHTSRHTLQIEEVKADKNFPK